MISSAANYASPCVDPVYCFEVSRRSGGVRTAARAVPAVVGWLVLVAVADLAVGALIGRGAAPEPPPDLLLAGPTSQAPDDSGGGGTVDPRVDVAAMAGAPWAEDYWEQFHSLEYEFVPFLPSYQRDSSLPYINVEDGVRRSYQPAGLTPDAPVVWFFGGSTMWGEGQRDLHTTASYVARLAERRGVTLRAVNFGERGRAHWEEMLRFERALAEPPEGGTPDVVVFYDGVNDIKVQDPSAGGTPSDDPTKYTTSGSFVNSVPPVLSADAPEASEPWLDTILERSLVLRLAGGVGLESPASADDAPTIDQMVTRTLAVYERGRALSTALAERAGVRPLFFWQPLFSNAQVGSPASLVRQRLTPPTIDITRAVDGVPYDTVYLDGAHINERGAELVAEAMLAHILSALEAPSA